MDQGPVANAQPVAVATATASSEVQLPTSMVVSHTHFRSHDRFTHCYTELN